jgi:hypothetical protein
MQVPEQSFLFLKGCPGWVANPKCFDLFIFSFLNTAAEPQRLPILKESLV